MERSKHIMSRSRISLVALLALAVAASALTGCGRKGLLRINGEKISKEEFYSRLERVPVQTIKGGRPVTVPAGQYVIEQIIGEKLVQQLAEKEGVSPTDEQVNQKVTMIKKNAGADFRMILAQQGRTEDEWRHQVRIEQALVNVVSKGITVPESKVKETYEEALKAEPSPFKRPEQVRISLIAAREKTQIDKAYDLIKGGQEFGSVASKFSEHESKVNKGQLPMWIARNQQGFPPKVVEIAFSLQPGKFSEPTKMEDTWVIVKLDQKRPPKTQTFAEVKSLLQEQLRVREGVQKNDFRKKLQQFTKSSEIVVNAERYKNIPDRLKKEIGEAMEIPGEPSGAHPNITR